MSVEELHSHLATGLTRVCQCWALERTDGVIFGFTDHDQPLHFDGITFAADSGLSAKALSSSTGLSVNNSEAVGLLQSDVIAEDDIAAGRYDNAKITNWLVQWDNVSAREIKFRGTLGDITRQNGSFEAELRGLSDALNQPQGRSYLKTCSAVLGDATCTIDVDDPAYRLETTIATVQSDNAILVAASGFPEGWFTHGAIAVLSGQSEGLKGALKTDRIEDGLRSIVFWEPLNSELSAGDQIVLTAGCDKRGQTCKAKFANFANFQGFPHIPGDDWLMSVPRASASADGGSLNE